VQGGANPCLRVASQHRLDNIYWRGDIPGAFQRENGRTVCLSARATVTVFLDQEAQPTGERGRGTQAGQRSIRFEKDLLCHILRSLQVTAKGFQKSSFESITLIGETPRNVDAKLTIGGSSETITVNANDVPVLNTSDASVGTSLSAADVTRLPVFGRDPYELLRLTPGVVSDAARSGSGSSVSLPNNQSGAQSNSGVFQTENQIQASAAGQRIRHFRLAQIGWNAVEFARFIGGVDGVTVQRDQVLLIDQRGA